MVFATMGSAIFDFIRLLITFWNYKILNLLNIIFAIFLLCIFMDLVLGIGVPLKIKGIFSIPGYPIVGNLFQVLNNPALVYIQWANKYNASIFQIRLGFKRIIVVNSFEDVNILWTKHSCSNNSRPVQYIFHGIVSATQGFTVGSTPSGPSYKRKKKVISQSLNQKSVNNLSSVIDNETKFTIKNIIQNNRELFGPPSCNNIRYTRTIISDIDLLCYAQLYSLRSAIFLTYGLHLDVYDTEANLAKEIIEVESNIMKFRAPVSNLQDYIPILRYLPFGKSMQAQHYRNRRDAYMNKLFQLLQEKILEGDVDSSNSLVGVAIKNMELTLKLTSAELQSICLTMVSAGLDNTSLNFNHLMGQLSQPTSGYIYQRKAFEEMMSKNKNNICTAWDNVAIAMDCSYVIALIKETLRYFTVLPLGLPRITTKDIAYKDAIIPKNSILFMNSYAANHDPNIYKDPMRFIPERWLDLVTGSVLSKYEISHFSFGAGSRMCSGNHLAFKELYTLTCRMILTFQIRRPTSNKFLMELDPFKNNSNPNAISFEPKLFKVRLEPRIHNRSDDLYNKILRS